jgi:hypothetical protein
MDDLFSPEVIGPAPRMGSILEGARYFREMHEEIGVLGRHQKALGFSRDRTMQHIAKIDSRIVVLLEGLHEKGCTCGRGLWGIDGHKTWFLKWLEGPGKAFDTRGKATL